MGKPQPQRGDARLSASPVPDPAVEAAARAAEDAARLEAERVADAERVAAERARAEEAEAARLEAERLEAERAAAVEREMQELEAAARLAAEKEQALAGKAQLIAPAGVTGASAGGVDYQVDEDGVVAVDPAHVAALAEHGFEPLE